MSSNGVRIDAVTEAECGVWIAGSSVNNPIEFSIAIVDLAIANGFELNTEVWEADRPVFVTGEPSFDMLDDLGFLTDFALDFLNENVAVGFYFEFDDGLVLYRDTDLDDEPAE